MQQTNTLNLGFSLEDSGVYNNNFNGQPCATSFESGSAKHTVAIALIRPSKFTTYINNISIFCPNASICISRYFTVRFCISTHTDATDQRLEYQIFPRSYVSIHIHFPHSDFDLSI